ncbi:hypothetical protein Q5P01_023855 [Channa striata]|uniref:Uncharacterized protein n=1 Tax=Channa striata TaxID=64152 RepID=A0AA88LR37_CHASR|nr:hypothetical protein Q5P01_023855 [Channa striata]
MLKARYQKPGHTSAFEHGTEDLTHFGGTDLDSWTLGFYTEDRCVIPQSRLDPCTQHERLFTKKLYVYHYFLMSA